MNMMARYKKIMTLLKPLGYDPNFHPSFTEHIVNTYGILRERPDTTGSDGDSYNNIQYLRNVVRSTVPPENLTDVMILLNCLYQMSRDDGKPLFIW